MSVIRIHYTAVSTATVEMVAIDSCEGSVVNIPFKTVFSSQQKVISESSKLFHNCRAATATMWSPKADHKSNTPTKMHFRQ